jgi:hypothetical protein
MNTKHQKPVSRRNKIDGIVEDAKLLGVTRQHLYLVLTEQRTSYLLLRRYSALQRERGINVLVDYPC